MSRSFLLVYMLLHFISVLVILLLQLEVNENVKCCLFWQITIYYYYFIYLFQVMKRFPFSNDIKIKTLKNIKNRKPLFL